MEMNAMLHSRNSFHVNNTTNILFRLRGIEAKEKCSCSNCEAWRRSGSLSETHRCDQCGKTFRVWGHYKAHLLNHNGTRPHGCSECNKSFVRLEDLRRHFLSHGAEFRFQCDKCDKMFYRADHLKNHKKCETKQG